MRIAVTCGDINGIGPEIALKAISEHIKHDSATEFIFISPKRVFEYEAAAIEVPNDFKVLSKLQKIPIGFSQLKVLTIPNKKQDFGRGTVASGDSALQALEAAKLLIRDGIVDALVTAPISKEAIISAGSQFHGHTEMIADWYKTKNYAMMFYSSKMIGGLLTIHVPLNKVASLVKKQATISTIRVIDEFLRKSLNIKSPELALLGINPHAGENGLIGSEDEYLKKMITSSRMNINGPFPADAYFGMKLFKKFDCTIAAYHDQLLIPFKMLSMEDGVNITAGLPFIRTSPDHGTAFNIAGTGTANPGSMISAITLAVKIAKNRARRYYAN